MSFDHSYFLSPPKPLLILQMKLGCAQTERPRVAKRQNGSVYMYTGISTRFNTHVSTRNKQKYIKFLLRDKTSSSNRTEMNV
ncbi:hypothetical protein HYC85_028629 [Camellia sinensis]|uniref:Uncharacterized protein n=1 Tax=Camellia sinensis TaxID=4442 RepID=A0A7J7FY12_CAMSI|nr:hypothetical protein HYC85_028629 [Camellia sinensis]